MTLLKNKTIQTGLAVLLTGFVFAGMAGSAESREPEMKSEPDSVILERHIRETKIENAVEEFSEHSFNAGHDEYTLDSLLHENGMRISGGSVYYSPDSAFKIFVVEGESCGAYCNPYHRAWLHFNDGSQLVINDVEFGGSNIEIKILPDGKYLIIETFWARPASVYSVTGHSAQVISFENYQIVRHPSFLESDPEGTGTAYGQAQEHFIDSTEYLNYDPSTQRLNYQYGNDLNFCCSVDSAYIYRGYMLYTDGKFSVKEEKRTFYKIPE